MEDNIFEYHTLNVFDGSTADHTARITEDLYKLGLPKTKRVKVVYSDVTAKDLDDPTFRGTPAMRETEMGRRLIKEHDERKKR